MEYALLIIKDNMEYALFIKKIDDNSISFILQRSFYTKVGIPSFIKIIKKI